MPIEVEDLLNQVDATIRGAVRHKLRVTLRASDYREQNLDALDVLQEIRLKLVRKLAAEGDTSIQQLSAYAATVAYRTCSDYLRARYPIRTSLKNTLRRLLDKAEDLTAWESPQGELLCGYPGWRNPAFAPDPARIHSLRDDPYQLPAAAIPTCAADHMRWPEWRALLEGVFHFLDSPVPLDDLIAIVAPVVGLEDVPDAVQDGDGDSGEDGFDPDALRSAEPTPEAHWRARERLQLYWAAILRLLVWHRVAFLMNHREGDLEALPLYGVATLEQIGDALELTDTQFAALASQLGVAPPSASASAGVRFLFFWKYLPLEDNIIAVLLQATRAQVISYRNKARERLQRMLRAEL